MYEFHVTLNLSFDQALEAVRKALESEKLAIISDVDVQAIFKNKLDKSIGAYRILGACNPGLADRVIEAEPNAGTLLPCNLVMREEGEQTVVSFMDPITVLGLSANEELRGVASEARVMMQKVATRLEG